PGRADNRGNRDHDCLQGVGGDPAVGGGAGVGEVGGGRRVHRDQGGNPGEQQLARHKRIVLDRRGGDVGEGVEYGRFVSPETSWLGGKPAPYGAAGDTTSSPLLRTGGITRDGRA